MTVRRLIFWVLIVAFLWLVVARFTEIQSLVDTLLQGQWQWVLAAAALQIVYYLVYTEQYRSAFSTVDLKRSLADLLPLTFAAIFVNVAAPAAGASGAALYVDDAKRRGESGPRAAVATLLTLVVDFSAFALILVVGLLYLYLQHDLQAYEVVGSLILLVVTLTLAGVLLLGVWAPTILQRLLSRFQGVVNCLVALFRRSPLLPAGWAEARSLEFWEAALAITTHPRRLGRTMAVALAAHVLDLASLYALFLAFHHPVGLGPLIAGYAMGILFWIVSITPQGIGVVEGVMTLVFSSLGVPSGSAAVIALAFRGLTFWLPLAIGFFMLQRVKSFSGTDRRQSRATLPQVLAVLTAGMGLVNLTSAVTSGLANRLALLGSLSPLVIRRGGHLTVALAGFALLLLSVNLWRRKRVAWVATEIFLVISALSHLLKGLDYEEAVLALSLAGLLWILRAHFHARSDPPSTQQGVRALALSLVFTLVYGTVGFYLLDRHFSADFSLIDAARQTFGMFVQFYDPGLEPLTGFGRYFAGSIYAVGLLTLSYAAWLLGRPVLVRQPAAEPERARARQIVKAHGRSSLARIALLPDKSFYFSPGGSVAAYVLKGRVAVVLGDPIGPREDAVETIKGFAAFSAQNDWLPAFYQTGPEYLDLYRDAGFDTLCIGQDAIVHLAGFGMEGHANKGLRSAYNRFVRLEYRAEVIQPPLATDLLDVLESVSDEWLTAMNGSEKRFSLGWFDRDYIQEGLVIVVRTPAGEICAFANLVPEYLLNELTIDLMRRRREVEHGIMDFLFVSLFLWAREQGYETFNLGLSAFSGVGDAPEDPAAERFMHYIYEHINQFYNFKGLHEFKEKFHPEWSPRYIVYPGAAALSGVWLAVVRANAGEALVGESFRTVAVKILDRSPSVPKVRLQAPGPHMESPEKVPGSDEN